ncbi:hypothetical protein ACFY1P_20235 [Streptomyces sp. NPDC001407]|uniref:hypothetical protein n=1 Tax=Streptomyces sp. NPDC001407 TaxID=3364573 RepID=UPI0036B8EA89
MAAFPRRAGLVDLDMDVIALARAGSRLQHTDQMLSHACDHLASRGRHGVSGSRADTALGKVHQRVAQARDDVLVAYGLATITAASQSEARDRALTAYSELADLSDGFDSSLEALRSAGVDVSLLARVCQTLGQAVVQLAHGIGDGDLAAGGDGRTPVRLAMMFTVHAEAVAAPATPR